MAGPEGDEVKQIAAYRENLRLESERIEEVELQQMEEEESRHAEALAQSFLTFKPIIEPMLEKIATNYKDEAGQPLDQPLVMSYEPVVTDSVLHRGHFALIWGTPKTLLDTNEKNVINLFERANKKLKNVKKLSSKNRFYYEEQLRLSGKYQIRISGINTLVFVTDIVDDRKTSKTAVVSLGGNVVLHDETKVRYNAFQVLNNEMVPVLSQVLKGVEDGSRRGSFKTNVRTFVTEGPQNLRPTGPFV